MPSRLQKGEKTVRLDFKLPASLKRKVSIMTAADESDDVASFMRKLVRRAWREYERMKKEKAS